MNELTKILKQNNFKVTPQRLAIYNILKGSKKHPCADSIYNKLLPMYPTMSLATVYKSIEVFKDLGVVQELNVGEGSFRYDANTNQHPHIICLKCCRVDDISDGVGFDLKDIVESKTNYKMVKQQLYFYGYCPDCKE